MRGWRLFAVPQQGEVESLAPHKAAQLASTMRANLDLLERAHVSDIEGGERRGRTIAELEAELNTLLAEFAQMKIIVDCLIDHIDELETQVSNNKK